MTLPTEPIPLLVDGAGSIVGSAGVDVVFPLAFVEAPCGSCRNVRRLFYNPAWHGLAVCGSCWVPARALLDAGQGAIVTPAEAHMRGPDPLMPALLAVEVSADVAIDQLIDTMSRNDEPGYLAATARYEAALRRGDVVSEAAQSRYRVAMSRRLT